MPSSNSRSKTSTPASQPSQTTKKGKNATKTVATSKPGKGPALKQKAATQALEEDDEAPRRSRRKRATSIEDNEQEAEEEEAEEAPRQPRKRVKASNDSGQKPVVTPDGIQFSPEQYQQFLQFLKLNHSTQKKQTPAQLKHAHELHCQAMNNAARAQEEGEEQVTGALTQGPPPPITALDEEELQLQAGLEPVAHSASAGEQTEDEASDGYDGSQDDNSEGDHRPVLLFADNGISTGTLAMNNKHKGPKKPKSESPDRDRVSDDCDEPKKGGKITEAFIKHKYGHHAEALAGEAKLRVRADVALGRWDPANSADPWIWPIILQIPSTTTSPTKRAAFEQVIKDASHDSAYQSHLIQYAYLGKSNFLSNLSSVTRKTVPTSYQVTGLPKDEAIERLEFLLLKSAFIHADVDPKEKSFTRSTAFRHKTFFLLLDLIFFTSLTGADSGVHKEIRASDKLPLPMLWMVVVVTEHVLGEYLQQKRLNTKENTKFTEQKCWERYCFHRSSWNNMVNGKTNGPQFVDKFSKDLLDKLYMTGHISRLDIAESHDMDDVVEDDLQVALNGETMW